MTTKHSRIPGYKRTCCTTSWRMQVPNMKLRQLLWLAVVVAIITTAAADDDTAKLEETRNQLQSAEAGGGKSTSSGSDESDERKTLSQQVADGKYGLIQRELFSGGNQPPAPGVLSYDANPEVPRDTSENLGGLAREEIWLAEDHLLVLRGGRFEPDDSATPFSAPVPPIDDYRAPARQVKIPSKPKVPPPFPVQFHDDGPIQILKAAPPEDYQEAGAPKGTSRRTNKTDAATGRFTKPYAARPATAQAPPSENYGGEAGKGAGPRKPPPLGPAPPPLDEDDPSIYYPPPYSFYYPRDNSSIVPPGPLVPGIVLPPPPNFFGKLVVTTVTPSTTTKLATKPTTTTTPPPSTTSKVYLPPPASTPPSSIVTQAPRPVYFEYYERNKVVPEPPKRPAPLQPPSIPIRTYVSSTAVPLRAYYKPPARPTQFYFYEEDPVINEVNSQRPPPRFYIATVARPQPQQTMTNNNFNHHIQQLKQQLRIQQRQQRYRQVPRYRPPRPVYQYSFGYEDRVVPTQQPPTQYNVQLQPSVDYRRPIAVQDAPQPVTPNPVIDHAYYTKQDENYFDDRTKKYFTVFGQKLTSPLPPLLRNDINVNYRRPLPPVNPHAEYLSGGNEYAAQGPSSDDGSGTYISYRLPGNGAHFYFLTPQLAGAQQQSRQRSDEASENGYYYPAPPRLERYTR